MNFNYRKNTSCIIEKKFHYAFAILIFSTLFLSCKKESQVNSSQENPEQNQIVKWLQANNSPSTPTKNYIIKNLLQTALFDRMYSETLNNEEKLDIIPLKNEYFSKQINATSTNNSHPIQYLIVVKNSKGEIRRGDIVLFYPTDATLDALPKNSFHDFFTNESLPVDGTFTLVSLSDRKQFEMDFKNGKNQNSVYGKAEQRIKAKELLQ